MLQPEFLLIFASSVDRPTYYCCVTPVLVSQTHENAHGYKLKSALYNHDRTRHVMSYFLLRLVSSRAYLLIVFISFIPTESTRQGWQTAPSTRPPPTRPMYKIHISLRTTSALLLPRQHFHSSISCYPVQAPLVSAMETIAAIYKVVGA